MAMTFLGETGDLMRAEVMSMKMKISILIAVLILGCSAAFGQTTVKLGFLKHDKQTQYCDYVQLTVEKTLVVTGVHYTAGPGTSTCFNENYNGTMAGLEVTIPTTSSLPVTGTVATFADNTSDEQSGFQGVCGCSEYYLMRLRPSTAQEIQDGVYGWVLYTNFGGTAAIQDYGFTTKQLGNPDGNSASYDENQ